MFKEYQTITHVIKYGQNVYFLFLRVVLFAFKKLKRQIL